MAAEPDGRGRWLVVTVRGPSEALDVAAEGLFACGAASVEEVDGGVRTYIAEPVQPDEFVATLAAALPQACAGAVAIDTDWAPDEDWAATWRRGLGPRRIGPNVIVSPSWCDPDARDGDIVVTIDPQMAFGTGEHASTRGVIRLMQGCVQPGDVVLDVGSGSAVLAITAVLLGAAHADAVEGDEEAMPNATENVARHDLLARVTLERAWVDEAYLGARAAAYDVIVANVLSGVLRPLLPSFTLALRPGGHLILAGILETEADAMKDAANAAGFAIAAEDREDGWWGVLLRSPA